MSGSFAGAGRGCGRRFQTCWAIWGRWIEINKPFWKGNKTEQAEKVTNQDDNLLCQTWLRSSPCTSLEVTVHSAVQVVHSSQSFKVVPSFQMFRDWVYLTSKVTNAFWSPRFRNNTYLGSSPVLAVAWIGTKPQRILHEPVQPLWSLWLCNSIISGVVLK